MSLVDLLMQGLKAVDANRLMKKGYAEVVFRNGKGQIESIKKIAVDTLKNQTGNNAAQAAMQGMQAAMQVANLAATIISTVIICKKLKNIDLKLDSMQKNLADLKEINFETQIAKPCRGIINTYRKTADKLSKGEYISGDDMEKQVLDCQDCLLTLINLTGKYPMDVELNLLYTLLPVLADYIKLYYEQNYDSQRPRNLYHDDWMGAYDLLVSEAFMEQVQDYLFLEQKMTNRAVNETLSEHKRIVETFRGNNEQLLADLETCGGVEGYEEAMQWSRQFAAQQTKSIQKELAEEYGEEQAKAVMEQVLQEAAIA